MLAILVSLTGKILKPLILFVLKDPYSCNGIYKLILEFFYEKYSVVFLFVDIFRKKVYVLVSQWYIDNKHILTEIYFVIKLLKHILKKLLKDEL